VVFVEDSTVGKNGLLFLCCSSGAEGWLYQNIKRPADLHFWVSILALKEVISIKKEYVGYNMIG